jgi:hypothetical protein
LDISFETNGTASIHHTQVTGAGMHIHTTIELGMNRTSFHKGSSVLFGLDRQTT